MLLVLANRLAIQATTRVPQAHDGFIVVNLGIGQSPTALLSPPQPCHPERS